MTRQQALDKIWKRLLIVFCATLAACVAVFSVPLHPRVGILLFLIGNLGGYVSVHQGLGDLKDAEVVELSASWWAVILPPFVGGVLAVVMYFLFLSEIVQGTLFPAFEPKEGARKGIESILDQQAKGDMKDYAKLFFWSFVAGFNQKYVVDIINSVKAKP
jgi:hypothetical protein